MISYAHSHTHTRFTSASENKSHKTMNLRMHSSGSIIILIFSIFLFFAAPCFCCCFHLLQLLIFFSLPLAHIQLTNICITLHFVYVLRWAVFSCFLLLLLLPCILISLLLQLLASHQHDWPFYPLTLVLCVSSPSFALWIFIFRELCVC